MNLSIYEPDEDNKADNSEANPDIIPFSLNITQKPRQEYLSIQEVAEVLWKTPEEILEWISLCLLPALKIQGEWKIIRKHFNKRRLQINEFFEDDPDKEGDLTTVTPAE